VPPDALRKDPGLLDRRRAVEVGQEQERPDRKPPGPARLRRIVLGDARDLDDAEQGLPDRGVEDRNLSGQERGPLRGRVGDDLARIDAARERVFAASANEQPPRRPYSRSITAAIAWPWPMHIVAMP
jgi:hypothetical protein